MQFVLYNVKRVRILLLRWGLNREILFFAGIGKKKLELKPKLKLELKLKRKHNTLKKEVKIW